MAMRRGWSCFFLSSYKNKTITNKKAQKKTKKKPCAVQMERSDPPALRTGNDKLRNSFKHVQRSLSGHRQAHRCEEREREWRRSGSKRAEETYRMDQPRDHKKGHVDLNVHTTTKGDRHPITQYNMWSRTSVEYHLPTRSKSRIVVVDWWDC